MEGPPVSPGKWFREAEQRDGNAARSLHIELHAQPGFTFDFDTVSHKPLKPP